MTPETQRLIDIRMFVDYRAKPQNAGPFHGALMGNEVFVRVYQSAHQRFYVEFRPDTKTMTVYSFALCATV